MLYIRDVKLKEEEKHDGTIPFDLCLCETGAGTFARSRWLKPGSSIGKAEAVCGICGKMHFFLICEYLTRHLASDRTVPGGQDRSACPSGKGPPRLEKPATELESPSMPIVSIGKSSLCLIEWKELRRYRHPVVEVSGRPQASRLSPRQSFVLN